MVRWIDQVRPSRRRFAPPQDEEELCMPLKIYLILRSAVRRVSKDAKWLCNDGDFAPRGDANEFSA
jgi:hypothetical protein